MAAVTKHLSENVTDGLAKRRRTCKTKWDFQSLFNVFIFLGSTHLSATTPTSMFEYIYMYERWADKMDFEGLQCSFCFVNVLFHSFGVYKMIFINCNRSVGWRRARGSFNRSDLKFAPIVQCGRTYHGWFASNVICSNNQPGKLSQQMDRSIFISKEIGHSEGKK